MEFIRRHAEKVIDRYRNEFPVVLVSGARQTGKTTVLQNYLKSEAGYLTFDDLTEENSAKEDPKMFLELHRGIYLFDEIQYVPDLLRYIKMEVDKEKKKGMYFLTGSQQLLLMEKASESLAGRIGIVSLYPFSRREITGEDFYLPFIPTDEYVKKRGAKKDVSLSDVWQRIFDGGYPAVVVGEVDRRDFYANYLKTYIERDIRRLSGISDELQFIAFITAVAARTGTMVNYSELSRDVGISEVTAKKWLSLLTTSGLVYLLRPFSKNIEKRVVKAPKLYFMDTGLAAYLTRWTSMEALQIGAMAGAMFETYVVGEIIKSFTNAGVEPPLYYYRDKDKIEIDALIYADNTIYPVEIKKTSTPSRKDAASLSIVNRIKDINIGRSTVVCNCSSPVAVKEGVLALPISYI